MVQVVSTKGNIFFSVKHVFKWVTKVQVLYVANYKLGFGKLQKLFANFQASNKLGRGSTFSPFIYMFQKRQTDQWAKLQIKIAHAKTKSECATSEWVSNLAAALGFEPRQTESESAVLPLHNAASLTPLYIQKIISQAVSMGGSAQTSDNKI